MRSLAGIIAAGGLLAVLAGAARADTVYLKNGARFEGAAEDRGDTVVLRLQSGSSVTIPKADVERIEKSPPPWEVYARRAAELKPGDAAGHLALARWCKDAGLLAQMRKELAAVIAAEPDNAEARAMLGHELVDGKWLSREEALVARGFVLADGKWLSPEEHARYLARQAQQKEFQAEKAAVEQLADADPAKAAAARKRFTDQGKAGWGRLARWASGPVNARVRLEIYKLADALRPDDEQFPLWCASRAIYDDDEKCVAELCRGIKERKDQAAVNWLIYAAAVENPRRRRAAGALRLIGDTAAYRTLIGCISAQPSNTLPGQAQGGVATSTNLGPRVRRVIRGPKGQAILVEEGGGMDLGEVVPAADSLEYISGQEFHNDVRKWLEWVEKLERAPGGALIDVGQEKK